MKFCYILLFLVVGCCGAKWKTISDFNEMFKEYCEAAENTIAAIENVIDSSKKESDNFFDKLYGVGSTVEEITLRTSVDKCNANFIDKDNLKFSFQIQVFQLEFPLRDRVIDIRQRLSDINSSINVQQGIADSKFWSCKIFNGSCEEETNGWLKASLHSLSCDLYPDCGKHSIKKRSYCSLDQFKCIRMQKCIPRHYFCDGGCDCSDGCSDEPPGCVKNCIEFRCKETFRCISQGMKCNGMDDCGDGSDEEDCPPPTTPPYTYANCSTDSGEFLCGTKKCIGLELVCNGHDDCGDGSDEGQQCEERRCSPDCSKMGGVCLSGPKGPECLYECPPGTFETSTGCSTDPEAGPATLAELIDDTPRLMTRFATRFKYLKTKAITALSKSMVEVVKCKRGEFSLLSKIMHFSNELPIQNHNSLAKSTTYNPNPTQGESAVLPDIIYPPLPPIPEEVDDSALPAAQ